MKAEVCTSCHQEIPQPKNVWLTAEQVEAQYGFDPTPHVLALKSKLAIQGDGHMVRFYLKDSVEALL